MRRREGGSGSPVPQPIHINAARLAGGIDCRPCGQGSEERSLTTNKHRTARRIREALGVGDWVRLGMGRD